MQEDLGLTDSQINLITSFGLLGLFFTFFAGSLNFGFFDSFFPSNFFLFLFLFLFLFFFFFFLFFSFFF